MTKPEWSEPTGVERQKNDEARTEHSCSLLMLMLMIVIVIGFAADTRLRAASTWLADAATDVRI